MSNIGRERAKAWEVYRGERLDGEATSMNAISFGFVATAILISMFLIMAIFEHLFKPTAPSSSSSSSISNNEDANRALQKLGNPQPGQRSAAAELSVVMPGHTHPTFIAQPAPFPFPSPSQREPIYWPHHT